MEDDYRDCKEWEEQIYWSGFQTVQFFQILSGCYHDQLAIPKKFANNMRERLAGSVVLKGPSGAAWNVNLTAFGEELYLTHGWKEFVEDHSLQEYDVLVFRYNNGDSQFDVLIFDQQSYCEKESSYFVRKCGHTELNSACNTEYEEQHIQPKENDFSPPTTLFTTKKARANLDIVQNISFMEGTVKVNELAEKIAPPVDTQRLENEPSDQLYKSAIQDSFVGIYRNLELQTRVATYERDVEVAKNKIAQCLSHVHKKIQEDLEKSRESIIKNYLASEDYQKALAEHLETYKRSEEPKKDLANHLKMYKKSEVHQKALADHEDEFLPSDGYHETSMESSLEVCGSTQRKKPRKRVASSQASLKLDTPSKAEATNQSKSRRCRSRLLLKSNRRPVTEEEKRRAKQMASATISSDSFMVIMRPCNVYDGFYMTIPVDWARTYLPKKTCDLTLRVKENTCQAKCYYRVKAGSILQGFGYQSFVLQNFLEEHDACVFKLASKSDGIIIDVSIFRVVDEAVPPSQSTNPREIIIP